MELIEVKRKESIIEEAPQPEKPKAALEAKFFVREVMLNGNRFIPRKELRPLLSPYEGRDLTLNEASQLTQILEQEYRRRGYITTLVYIPPQRIENGLLILEVLEGRFGRLYIEGNRWFSEKSIRRYWTLQEADALDYDELQKSLRRINAHPDRQAQIVLRPGTEKGTTDAYLKVKDKFPGHVRFQLDNQGTRNTGRRRFGFVSRYNNTVIPDSFLLTGTIFGKDFGSFFAQYLIPVTSFGTKVVLGFSHSQAAPKRQFKGSDVHGNATNYSLSLRQTLVDKDRVSANAFFGFDFKENRTRDTSGVRRKERLRVLRPGIDVTQYDSNGGTFFSNQFSFGLTGLGASGEGNPLSGRLSTDPNFVKYTASIFRSLRLPFQSQANFKIGYQISLDKLLPQEEFYLGGADTVRGYPEGDYLADQAVLANVEYLFPVPYLKFPGLQGIVFLDKAYGRVRGKSAAEFKKRHLLGIGGGLRIRLKKYLSARLEFGHALGEEPLTESDHSRLHFQLQVEV